jgi:hypothetical protein
MSDYILRQAARVWISEQDGASAIAYLNALTRAGKLEDLEPIRRVWRKEVKAIFDGRKQNNATVRIATDGVRVLLSYGKPVAAYIPEHSSPRRWRRLRGNAGHFSGTMLWSPDLAWSVTSSRHVTRWLRELEDAKRVTVSADELRQYVPPEFRAGI